MPAVTTGTSRGARIGTVAPPDREWLKLQAAEEILYPDLPVIDTHHHLWTRVNNEYLIKDLLADIDGGHNVVATVTSECDMMYRKTGPEELKPVGETEFIVRLIEERTDHQDVDVGAGIVGFADFNLGDKVEAVLDAHVEAAKGRFRGVRYSTTHDASKEIPNRGIPDILARPQFRAGLSRLAAKGLVFDSWVFHPQLPEVIDLARALPDLSIVCCHAGGQLGYGPYAGRGEEVFSLWKASMAELASCPNVTVKLGGLVMRLAAFDYTSAPVPPTSALLATLWEPAIATCVEFFGADRCMFESNFPVDKMAAGYTVLWNAYKRLAAKASDAERLALFSGTARRVYKLA